MLLTLLALLLALTAAVLGFVILRHAFRRSTGTGVMVLLVPCYVLVYAFSQFEHRRKPWVVMGFVGSAVLAAALLGVAMHLASQARVPPPSELPGFMRPGP